MCGGGGGRGIVQITLSDIVSYKSKRYHSFISQSRYESCVLPDMHSIGNIKTGSFISDKEEVMMMVNWCPVIVSIRRSRGGNQTMMVVAVGKMIGTRYVVF